MIIKELRIRNIASIEAADIDFENGINDVVTGQPSSIFLISGDTGSGKSVLLDAISMALYKNTPRIAGVANKKQNDYADTTGETISIFSLEQYTRLGISAKDECYSEVVFEGNDGLLYRAKLELGINKNLKHRSPVWTVKVGDADWCKVESNTGEPIRQAIGLSFEQFGRMAMLAQGQFATFLTGDKKEREAILEQLTNTEIFSRYGEAIARIFKRKEALTKEAAEKLAVWQEQVEKAGNPEELNHKYEELVEQRKQLQDVLGKEEEKLEVVKQTLSYMQEQESQQALQQRLKLTIDSPDFQQKVTLVKDWDQTNQQRLLLTQMQQAMNDHNEANKELAKDQSTYAELAADLLWLETEIIRKSQQANEMQQCLVDMGPKAEVMENQKVLDQQLATYAGTVEDLHKADHELLTEQAKTKGLEEAATKCQETEQEAQAEVQAMQGQIEALQQQREDLHPEETNTAIESANKQQNVLLDLSRKQQDLTGKQAEAKAKQVELEQKDEQLNTLANRLEAAQTKLTQAELHQQEVQGMLSTLQMSLDDKLKELRQKMQQTHTEVCPLCGQKVNHLFDDKDFVPILTPLQEAEAKAKEAYRLAKAEHEQVNKGHATLKGELKTLTKAYQLLLQQNAEAQKAITTAAEACQLDKALPLDAQIAGMLDKVKADLGKHKDNQQKAETLQKRINNLLKDKAAPDKKLKAAQEALVKARNAVDKNRHNIDTIRRNISTFEDKRQSQSTALDQQLGTYYPTWKEDVTACRSALMAEAAKYATLKKAYEDCQKEVAEAENLVGTLQSTRSQLLAKHPDWQAGLNDAQGQQAGLQTGQSKKHRNPQQITAEWTSLFARTTTHDEALQKAAKSICETTQGLQTYYTTSGKDEASLQQLIATEAQIPEARRLVTQTTQDLTNCEEILKALATKIANGLARLDVRQPEQMPRTDELVQKVGLLKEKLSEIALQQGIIQNSLKTLHDNLDSLQKAEAAHKAAELESNRWDKLNDIFGGTRFRTLVQTYILRPMLRSANLYLRDITDRYTLTCSEDNEQLSILVHDRYNKDQIRSVTVLSGGERFMISLALSLAISTLNRPDMNVNILFIDEGFGTLDEKNLNSVMSTLEKLQEIAGQSNRRVGLISHREELIERIPNKILVEKKGEGRSIVRIENS